MLRLPTAPTSPYETLRSNTTPMSLQDAIQQNVGVGVSSQDTKTGAQNTSAQPAPKQALSASGISCEDWKGDVCTGQTAEKREALMSLQDKLREATSVSGVEYNIDYVGAIQHSDVNAFVAVVKKNSHLPETKVWADKLATLTPKSLAEQAFQATMLLTMITAAKAETDNGTASLSKMSSYFTWKNIAIGVGLLTLVSGGAWWFMARRRRSLNEPTELFSDDE